MKFLEQIGMAIAVVITSGFLVVFVPVFLVYSYLSYGYVVSILWEWFIPFDLISFHPTFWQAVGIVFFMGVLMRRNVHQYSYLNKDLYNYKSYMITYILLYLLGPWIFLFIGWGIHNKFFIF